MEGTLILNEIAILIAVLFGWFMGIMTPFVYKWFSRLAAKAELRLRDMRHQQSVLHGKTSPNKPVLQQTPVSP